MHEPVPPNGHLTRRADDHFLRHLGVGFEALAAPVDAANPVGLPARATSVYRAIIEARQGDEDAQPRGVWQRQPKRSDWPHVSLLAAAALRSQGKDLQLAAWLCEAQVHEHGLGALAPCMLLLHTLCERYWNALHPQLEQESEHEQEPEQEQQQQRGQQREPAAGRANIIRWLDQKLVPTLRLAPMIAAENGNSYTWTDWEQGVQAGDAHSPIAAALTATPSSLLSEQRTALQDALKTIGLTQQTFDDHLGAAAPRLDLLSSQVSDILRVLQTELQKREPATVIEPSPVPAPDAPAPPPAPRFRNRADAYACLAEAAAYLAEVEPHSPTPYLVKRAVEWGNMNTGALYQELFIRLGGQLSIFDMVGSDMLTAPPPRK